MPKTLMLQSSFDTDKWLASIKGSDVKVWAEESEYINELMIMRKSVEKSEWPIDWFISASGILAEKGLINSLTETCRSISLCILHSRLEIDEVKSAMCLQAAMHDSIDYRSVLEEYRLSVNDIDFARSIYSCGATKLLSRLRLTDDYSKIFKDMESFALSLLYVCGKPEVQRDNWLAAVYPHIATSIELNASNNVHGLSPIAASSAQCLGHTAFLYEIMQIADVPPKLEDWSKVWRSWCHLTGIQYNDKRIWMAAGDGHPDKAMISRLESSVERSELIRLTGWSDARRQVAL